MARALTKIYTAVATDDFNRADGSMGANWLDDVDPWVISGNKAVPADNIGDWIAWYQGAGQWADDQYAQAVFANLDSAANLGAGIGLTLRQQSFPTTGVRCIINQRAGLDSLTLGYFPPKGGWTDIVVKMNDQWVNGDTVRLEAFGTELTCYRNGGLVGRIVIPHDPVAVTVGGQLNYPGLAFSSGISANLGNADSFEAGTITQERRYPSRRRIQKRRLRVASGVTTDP